MYLHLDCVDIFARQKVNRNNPGTYLVLGKEHAIARYGQHDEEGTTTPNMYNCSTSILHTHSTRHKRQA